METIIDSRGNSAAPCAIKTFWERLRFRSDAERGLRVRDDRMAAQIDDRLQQEGVTTYMHKPFNLVKLIDTVHQRC